jgi:hypothetical protein
MKKTKQNRREYLEVQTEEARAAQVVAFCIIMLEGGFGATLEGLGLQD